MLEANQIYEGDCLEVMHLLDDQSVDMILCDLPYGTTACKWDTPLPLEPLWKQHKRIIRPRGAIVLTASQPFTSVLISSWLPGFKYCWVWEKIRPTGFANAKKRPLKLTEDICVFNSQRYFPQGLVAVNRVVKNSRSTGGETTGAFNYGKPYVQTHINYPTDVLHFPLDEKCKTHPTQKPVALFEYLIRTYTNEGDLVLDSCLGSGTTAVACIKSNRKFIGIEKEPKYIEIARRRIEEALP